jgi:hypothetical protein
MLAGILAMAVAKPCPEEPTIYQRALSFRTPATGGWKQVIGCAFHERRSTEGQARTQVPASIRVVNTVASLATLISYTLAPRMPVAGRSIR